MSPRDWADAEGHTAVVELLDEAHYDALYEALDHREVQAALSTCGGDDHGDDDPAHDECSAGLSKEDLSTCETALRWTREQLRARKPMARSKELRTDGATVLHFAAAWGFRVTARVAIELGADVDATEEAGDTPLLTAAWFGDADIVQLLLSHDAAVDAISPKGETSLHLAARRGHKNIVDILIAEGADLDIEDTDGDIPLDIASIVGDDAVRAALMDAMQADRASAIRVLRQGGLA